MLGIRPDQIARISLAGEITECIFTLSICKKALDNFESAAVQNVIMYEGSKNVGVESPYKRLLVELIEIYSGGIEVNDMGVIMFMNTFLQALKENEKILAFQRKREELRELKKRVKELESEVGDVE